jgi:aminocarboxymuconate-semialdehyde decarboxylase
MTWSRSSAPACAVLQNDEIAAVVTRHSDRFVALATLPLQDPQRAADELRRAMRVLGLRGAQIGSNVNGRNLDDPALEAVWAAANELRAFILVHPHGEILPGDRLKSYYMRNFVGLPFETTMAGAALVFGGVIERYPTSISACATAGGFLPYQAGRFMHAFSVRDEAKARLRGSPQDSLSACITTRSCIRRARSSSSSMRSGPGRVLMGMRLPFDMGELGCVALSRRSLSRVLPAMPSSEGAPTIAAPWLIFDSSGRQGCGEPHGGRGRPPVLSRAASRIGSCGGRCPRARRSAGACR